MAEGDFQDWVGRTEEIGESLDSSRVAALAATLGVEVDCRLGAPLPPGWHWSFFNRFAPRGELGVDGHPKRGGFLPPIDLPRRMWAGGRITYERPLKIGAAGIRISTIAKVESKSGRAGRLVFVTVTHRLACEGTDCLVEEQDIVYRDAATPGSTPPLPPPAPEGAEWSETFRPDSVLLFRFSALTSNGHRIHYDADYVRREENYPDLVVHGPLTALLLQDFAMRRARRPLRRFQYRGVSPLFVSAPFELKGRAGEGGAIDVWARTPEGGLAMQATAFV